MPRPRKTHPVHTTAVLTILLTLVSLAHGTPVTLLNGVAVRDLSGTVGSQELYLIDVPIYQSWLNIGTSGGIGDCDLYVKYDAAPTTVVYDYRAHVPGNNESIAVRYPATGPWYIMLQGTAAYSGVTLQANFSPCPNTPIVPAPTALLLGSFGAGAVSWLRRRRAL